jgi:prevent-host-death family protein
VSDLGPTIGVEEERARLGQVVDQATRARDPIMMTNPGLAAGVLISRDEYARLLAATSKLARKELAGLRDTRQAVAEAGHRAVRRQPGD